MKLRILYLLVLFLLYSCSDTRVSLENIKITGNTNSIHYADVVMDSLGNSYIASSYKNNEKEFISIIKTSPKSKNNWELASTSEGKAMAIDMDKHGNLWVCGIFKNVLQISKNMITSSSETSGFLAALRPDGTCFKLIKIDGVCIPYNISINNSDEILINGILGNELKISGKKYIRKNTGNIEFYALLKSDLSCAWIKEMKAKTTQIHSFEKDFIIASTINGNTFWGEDTITSSTHINYDGILFKIDNNGNKKWLTQLGNSSSNKNEINNKEFVDFIITSKETITTLVSSSSKKPTTEVANKENSYKLFMNSFSQDGKSIKNKLISESYFPNIACITNGSDNSFWIAGIADKNKIKNQEIQYLNKYSQHGKLIEEYKTNYKKGFAFRSATSSSAGVSFTGHYKKTLTINNKSLKTNNKSTLFEYKIITH